MANEGAKPMDYRLVKVGTLELEDARFEILYRSIAVLSADTLIVRDYIEDELWLYNRHSGKLLARYEEIEDPWDVCVMDETGTKIAVTDTEGHIQILSVESRGESSSIRLLNTLDVRKAFFSCHGLGFLRSEGKLVVSGVKLNKNKDPSEYCYCWGLVSIENGKTDTLHEICKCDYNGDSHLALSEDNSLVYITIIIEANSPDNGVYAFDVMNGRKKFVYCQSDMENLNGISADRNGFIYVCNRSPPCIYQLTQRLELVKRHMESIPPQMLAMCIEEQQGEIYVTSFGCKEICRLHLEWGGQQERFAEGDTKAESIDKEKQIERFAEGDTKEESIDKEKKKERFAEGDTKADSIDKEKQKERFSEGDTNAERINKDKQKERFAEGDTNAESVDKEKKKERFAEGDTKAESIDKEKQKERFAEGDTKEESIDKEKKKERFAEGDTKADSIDKEKQKERFSEGDTNAERINKDKQKERFAEGDTNAESVDKEKKKERFAEGDTKAESIDKEKQKERFADGDTNSENIDEKKKKGLPPEILRMDKRSQQLFREALEAGKEKVYNIRVMIVGHLGVGKTTLAKRILGEEVAEAPHVSTEGIEVHPRCCKVDLDTKEWIVERNEHRFPDNGQSLVNIVSDYAADNIKNSKNDINEEEKINIQHPLTDTEQDIIAGIQHDEIDANSNSDNSTTDHGGEEHIHEKQYSLDPIKPESGKPASVAQTRKTKIMNNSNNAEIGDTMRHSDLFDFVTKFGTMTYSEKTFCYVTMLDFAGEFVFYTTHQVFMSWRTIYLLVTDMSKSLDELVKDDKCSMKLNKTMECSIQDYAVYWLNSIYSHGLPTDTGSKVKESNERETDKQIFDRAAKYPPVILVATHSDKVPEGGKNETRNDYFDGVRRILKERPQRFLLRGYFALSNFGPDADFDALKQKIVESAQEQDYWGEEIPGRWLALEQKLMELKRRGLKIIEYSDVEKMNTDSDVKIESPEELEVFLRFEHDLGNIVFFNTPKLRDKIVLDTDWLMDGVRILITPPQHVFEDHPEIHPELYHFLDTGRLTEPVIACLWSKKEQDIIHKNRNHLLELMEKLSIIAKPVGKCGNVQDQKQYYWVPCVICKPAPDNVKNPQPRQGMTRTTTLCFVSTTKFIHVGVFHRLVASLLSMWPSAEKDGVHHLYSGCCEFEVDGCHNLLLALNDHVILATMFRYSSEEEYPDKTLCNNVRRIISSTLDDIMTCISPNSDFDIRVMCDKSSTYTIEGSHAISNKKEIRCKCSKQIHSVKVEHLLKFWEKQTVVTDSEEGKHPKVSNLEDSFLRQTSINQISGSILTNLSKDLICKDWKFFFRALSVSDNELDEVVDNVQGNVKEQIYQLLRLLNQRGCLNKTSITEALKTIGRHDLVGTYNSDSDDETEPKQVHMGTAPSEETHLTIVDTGSTNTDEDTIPKVFHTAVGLSLPERLGPEGSSEPPPFHPDVCSSQEEPDSSSSG